MSRALAPVRPKVAGDRRIGPTAGSGAVATMTRSPPLARRHATGSPRHRRRGALAAARFWEA